MPTYSHNKKAHFDYEILDTLEAGIELFGHEVKSIRSGHAGLLGAYVTFHNGEALITGAHIPLYRYATNKVKNYDPDRSRRLLLNKHEISRLQGKSQEQGLTIVPLSLYTKGPHIKLKIAVARGKKKYDKRETIKKREVEREIRRKLKE